MPLTVRTALLVLCSLPCTSAFAANGPGTVRTVVLGPNSLVNTARLDFGSLIPGSGGTITINPQTGASAPTGGVIRAGGTISRAQFVGSGTAGRVVTISATPSPSITISNGVNTMTINQLRVSVDGGGPQPFGPNHRIGTSGIINIAIGGRLNVGANQAVGLYSGTIALTMNYQ